MWAVKEHSIKNDVYRTECWGLIQWRIVMTMNLGKICLALSIAGVLAACGENKQDTSVAP
jgi:hypothetical protein